MSLLSKFYFNVTASNQKFLLFFWKFCLTSPPPRNKILATPLISIVLPALCLERYDFHELFGDGHNAHGYGAWREGDHNAHRDAQRGRQDLDD